MKGLGLVTFLKKQRIGFTLMEILAALAILGGSAFVLFNVHFNAMRLHQVSFDMTDEYQLVNAVCSRAEVGVLTGTLEDGGDLGPRFEGYSWNYSAVPIGSDASIPLYMVTVNLNTPNNESKTYNFLCFNLNVETQDSSLSRSGGSTRRVGSTTGNVPQGVRRGNTLFGR